MCDFQWWIDERCTGGGWCIEINAYNGGGERVDGEGSTIGLVGPSDCRVCTLSRQRKEKNHCVEGALL